MNRRQLLACASLLLACSLSWAQGKVVYHVNDAEAQASTALRNLRNHLDLEPKTEVVVVANGLGVDFLLDGAKDKSGKPYAGPVAALKSRGVRFEVCENTMAGRSMKKEQFLPEADFTPSGVVRLTQLQNQGYAYIKP